MVTLVGQEVPFPFVVGLAPCQLGAQTCGGIPLGGELSRAQLQAPAQLIKSVSRLLPFDGDLLTLGLDLLA
ncbi:hypothetical protein [Nonomuraea sp. NPDC052265]|uniref:hypothetical protein n=1 Tax=Nonomuraea sp. NPDC052265 TaxID=3364374 RepID=UPI0037CA0DAC